MRFDIRVITDDYKSHVVGLQCDNVVHLLYLYIVRNRVLKKKWLRREASEFEYHRNKI